MLRKGKPSGREQDILHLLVQTYITSGTPVGSKTLSGQLEGSLSPATIRNTMAELEELGYLTHPHTSAGRIPSEKGFRYYVDTLPESSGVDRASERQIERLLGDNGTPEELMSRTSFVLSSISQSVGIVVAPPLASTQMKHIEFLDLGDGKILVIFVSKSGLLQRKVIRVKDRYPQAELDRVGRFLVERFTGKTLTDVRNELMHMMEAERTAYDRMLQLLRIWNDTLDDETTPGPEGIFMQGTVKLLHQPEFADIGRMRELFEMFEEKDRILKILNECIGSNSGIGSGTGAGHNVKVSIGSELGDPAMRDFTVITSSYVAQDNMTGFLGIIGPIRMEYQRVIAAVSHLGRIVGQRINA